jgi:CheY-like chemotaxis protein
MSTEGDKRPEVLYIEPHPILRAILHEALPDLNIDTAESVDEGREKINRRVEEHVEMPYDLIVLETSDPNSEPGIKLVDELKDSDATKNIPILVHNTDDNDLHREYLRKKGVKGYLVKGPDTDTLPQRIRDITRGTE